MKQTMVFLHGAAIKGLGGNPGLSGLINPSLTDAKPAFKVMCIFSLSQEGSLRDAFNSGIKLKKFSSDETRFERETDEQFEDFESWLRAMQQDGAESVFFTPRKPARTAAGMLLTPPQILYKGVEMEEEEVAHVGDGSLVSLALVSRPANDPEGPLQFIVTLEGLEVTEMVRRQSLAEQMALSRAAAAKPAKAAKK